MDWLTDFAVLLKLARLSQRVLSTLAWLAFFKRYKFFECRDLSKPHLQTQTHSLKKHTSAAFEKCQALEMLTQKLFALSPLCDAVRYVGGIKYLHTGAYEALHNQFKATNVLCSLTNVLQRMM